MDKTGTITEGKPKVTDIVPAEGVSEKELLEKAYALEVKSEHPLALAVVDYGNRKSVKALPLTDFKILSGHGLEGTLGGKKLHGGSASYISTLTSIKELKDRAEALAEEGKTPLFFEEEGKLLGLMAVADVIKEDSKESPVKFFKAMLPAALNAFGTCSSSATIPISKQRMEDEMGVSNKITSIAIPLGATVNMDAVSILMSFMIMFFANACGINVSISMMIIILLANVLLSVGTPGIPGGAIASFAALATMAGLPAGVMGVYISINTLCDMGATCVNVIGDMAGCVVLKEKIKLED